MKIFSRLMITLVIVIVIFVLSWGVVYASAGRMMRLSPAPGSLVTTARPVIKASGPNLPGAPIKMVSLTIDNERFELNAPSVGSGFAYQPEKPLSEGEHEIKVEMTYVLGAARNVS